MPAKTSLRRLKHWTRPRIEDGKLSKWNWVVICPKNLKRGKRVDIGAFAFINATNGVTLEDDTQIGPGAKILSASTIDHKYGPVIMKKKSCVGANSVVMPNITIGENAIVGALSFVNKNIPANEVWVGAPIRKLR
jgi:acetyltransferase-like isoleucine patch superfamily enzyme